MAETNTTDDTGSSALKTLLTGEVIGTMEETSSLWRELEMGTTAMEIPGKGVVLRSITDHGVALVHLHHVQLRGVNADGNMISEHAPTAEKDKAVEWRLV